jgi:hypothetical protein
MKPKEYKSVVVYFDPADEVQFKAFQKLREMSFKDEITSISEFLRNLAIKKLNIK